MAGTDTAGKWVLILIVYFFVLITVVTYTSNLDSNVTYSGGSIGGVTEGQCNTPKSRYNQNFELVTDAFPNSASCENTLAIIDQDACESINGCEWTNQTSCWIFFTCDTEIETCRGNINVSDYNNGSEFGYNNLCNIPGFNENKTACELVGCTYSYVEVGQEDSSINGVYDTVRDMATFNTDIGLPSAYNYLFNFIFFYLMGIVLIIVIAMYARG